MKDSSAPFRRAKRAQPVGMFGPSNQMYTVILLGMGSLALVTLVRLLTSLSGLEGLGSVLLGALGTLLGFLLPAVLGLFVLDGDRTDMLPMRVLSAPHKLYGALTGVLAICPMSLLADISAALLVGSGVTGTAQTAAPDMGLFLPMMLASGLLAPVCEELFFRGYMLNALRRGGDGCAVLAAALLFALAHGLSAQLASRVLLGLLLGLLLLRTGSLFAPMLTHACYNMTVICASFLGLGGLFSGLTFFSCVLRLLGSTAFVWALHRTLNARASHMTAQRSDGRPLTRRQRALLILALLALLAALIMTGISGVRA